MIKGMTGFGSVEISTKTIKAVIEIKSVNHRYLDVNYYLPIGWASNEEKIRQMIQKMIARGRITVSVKVSQRSSENVSLNKGVVRKYLKYAKDISKEFGLKYDVGIADVIKLPGVFENKEELITPEVLWPQIENGIQQAIVSLLNMRKREGKSLACDLTVQMNKMTNALRQIKKRSDEVLKEKKAQLPSDEYKSFEKGVDIHEEISRMFHHIQEMKMLLKSDVAVGKKIDFVAQEMQRETNTMGSKLQDKIVTSHVIALKSKIEKIREQAQNIE
ncbi:MAG TPA: YicC family protein [Candidatus Omnitrophota bacterium]|nr:YicC family protein [Candidatus Omnitrophota bacterium]HPN87935.1 YicC family protein [Candidatus Omnitrophota bacterium]